MAAEAQQHASYDTESKDTQASMEALLGALLAMGHDPLSKKNCTGADYVDNLHHDTYPFIDPKQFDLSGRSVFITGASKGIGRATAVSYAKAGVSNIGIGARSSLDEVVREISEAAKGAGREPPNVLAVKMDVSKRESVENAMKEVGKTFGDLDVLLNNAGSMETNLPMTEVDPDDWWQVFQVNILGTFLTSRALIPLLLKKKDGLKTIVNINSLWGLTAFPNCSAYQMSKFALLRFSGLLNAEYGSQGLLSYHVHPGGVNTELASPMADEIKQFLIDAPEMPADTLVWFTAERREWLAGRYLSAQWDMEELLAKREKIEKEDHLKMRMAVGRD